MNSYSYTPFGELLAGEDSGYRFNGEYYDSATGMLNLRARQYEPQTMRFEQRDIWRGEVESPTTQNRYLYCINDPIGYYDRSGNRVDEDAGKPKKGTTSRVPVTSKMPKSAYTMAQVARAEAAGNVGIDKTDLTVKQRKVVEAAEKTLREKTLKGTLTEREKQHVIRGACTTVRTMQALNQLGTKEYWERSWDIARKGDYAEDFTAAGLVMQIGIGVIPGVGQVADIRDFVYAVTHTKGNSFWGNAALISLALVALIPVVGDLAKGLKGVKYLKYADKAADVLDAAGDVAKYEDELIDAGVDAAKGTGSLDGFKMDLQLFAKKDIKQIQDIAKQFDMDTVTRREFGDYVESLKDLVPNNKNFTYNELVKIAEEFMGVE